MSRRLHGLALLALYAITCLLLREDAGRLALGLVLCTLLVAVTYTDLDRRLIPNRILLAGAGAGIAIGAVADPGGLGERAIAAGAGGGALLAVALAHPAGMGMGDVKLVAVIGLYLGRAIAPALLVGLAAGALGGAAMIARHGWAARRRAIPFGPSLAVGGLIGLWFGDPLVGWYVERLAPAS